MGKAVEDAAAAAEAVGELGNHYIQLLMLWLYGRAFRHVRRQTLHASLHRSCSMKHSLPSKLLCIVATLARLRPERQVMQTCMHVGFGVVKVMYSLQVSPRCKCSEFTVDA